MKQFVLKDCFEGLISQLCLFLGRKYYIINILVIVNKYMLKTEVYKLHTSD